jgi:4-amino-4-deoxy-L-arabinose transferase-like glycosyltransferase
MASKNKKNKSNYLLAALAVVFFLGSLFLVGNSLYISPDETASAFFVNTFNESQSFRASESANLLYDNAVHPRSMKVQNGDLVPGSFIGLPVLYGFLVYIFGGWILPLLTPLIALLAIFCWNKLLKEWFSKEVAFVGTVVAMFHPALWYYSVRGLMHNVLFVSLIIIATYLFFTRPIGFHLKRCKDRIGKLANWQKYIDLVFVGVLLSLALFTRLSEVYWVGALFIFFIVIKWKQIRLNGLILLILSFLIAAVPFLLINNATYSSPFVTGYNLSQTSQLVTQGVEAVEDSSIVFPFGFHPRAALVHIEDYAISLFWWLSIMAALGLPLFLRKQKNRKVHLTYFKVFVVMAIWLGIWYGSWTFFDNPDRSQITIANSYIRYWLPLFIMSTPFIASFIVWVSSKAKSGFARKSVVAIFLTLIISLSANIVFFNGPDAFMNVSKVLVQSEQIKAEVLLKTEPDSIIIVDRSDKIFFPDRKVIHPLRSERTFLLMPTILENTTLYYYGITFPLEDLEHLNNGRLKELNLEIQKIKTYKAESLYKIYYP